MTQGSARSTLLDSLPTLDVGKSTLAFNPLFELLAHRGFVLGVDQRLLLQQLLDEVGTESSPADLKHLLCPLCATDEQQQEIFYETFDQLYPLLAVQGATPRLETPPKPQASSKAEEPSSTTKPRSADEAVPLERPTWPYWIAGVTLFVLVVAAALLAPWTHLSPSLNPVEMSSTEPALREPTESTVEGPGNLADPPDQEIAGPSPESSASVAPRPSTPSPEPELLELAKNSTRRILLVVPFLLLAVFELYRHYRARWVLRRQPLKRPPFLWPLQLDSPSSSPFDGEVFRNTSRSLRRRLPSNRSHLDVAQTIHATVAAAGRVQIRYRATTKVPEYLALIDRATRADHSAGFATELTRALEHEGLFVHIFFFDRDPRACEDPQGHPIPLEELTDRFAGDRLLVFSDGSGFLDAVTGSPAPWTQALHTWNDRALLSPSPPQQWRVSEITLAGHFFVVPATVAGLRSVAESFESGNQGGLRMGSDDRLEGAILGGQPSQGDIRSLRESLGAPTFQWLCACAVHPELQWNLTLHLGTLPVMEPGLLNEENLLRLVRLPWFRSGRLPSSLRWELIKGLEPTIEHSVRAELTRLLEHHPPPSGSIADATCSLQLAIQKAWLARHEGRTARPFLRQLRTVPPSRWRRDPPSLQVVESLRPSILDLVVPRQARKLLLREGFTVHGVRSAVLVVLAVALTTSLWWALPRDLAPEVPTALNPAERSLPPQISTEPQESSVPETLPLETNPPEAQEPITTALETPSSGSVLESSTQPTPSPSEPGSGPRETGAAQTNQQPVLLEPAPNASESSSDLTDRTLDPATEEIVALNPDSVAQGVPPTPEVSPTESPAAGIPIDSSTDLGIQRLNVADDGTLTMRIPLTKSTENESFEIPIERFQRPINYALAQIETGVGLLGRSFVECTIEFSNGGGNKQFATLTVDLVDASGTTIASESRRKEMSQGADSIKVRLARGDDSGSAVALNLSLVPEYAPGPIRRLVDYLAPDSPEPPHLDPALIEMSGGQAIMTVPLDLGKANLDLYLEPIDLQSVSTTLSGRRVAVAVFIANPSRSDQRVNLIATALDRQGSPLAENSDRRLVESGELDKKLDVSLRLSEGQLAATKSIRLVVSSQPD